MTIELTTQEKIDIINSHIKNIAINKYNIQLNLVEEDAKVTPDAGSIASYNSQISQMTNQIAALQSELNTLSSN